MHRSGLRATSGPLTIIFRGTDGAVPRVAFAVGKVVGHAVCRNTIRRKLRAEMQQLAGAQKLAQGDYLLRIRPHDSGEELRHCLAAALQKLETSQKTLKP